MNTCTIFAPAKVNLFLEILNKRKDGYHNIRTIFQTINLFDILYLKESSSGIKLHCTDSSIPNDNRNLAYKSAKLLINKLKIKRGVSILLEKNIPVGAGLGGGSSDAAAVFHGLNKMWELGLNNNELINMARDIGADVPFFITGGTALGSGIGDKLKKLKEMPESFFILVKPDFNISTEFAYNLVDKNKKTKNKLTINGYYNKILNSFKKGDIKAIAGNLYNDFEDVIFEKKPVLTAIKEMLIKTGGIGALMTGSGSAVYAIVESQKEALRIQKQMRKNVPWVYISRVQNSYA
ncbi:MAG: 4-(cytidine 5'-diphospho)-2-C-methyl-D-erythritol kinase [Candidatus Firestonebacteria bacterium]